MVKKLNIEKNFIAEISKNWQAGDLIVVSSRPGMGKSKFLLSIIKSSEYQQTPSELIPIKHEGYNSDSLAYDCTITDNVFRSLDDIRNYIERLSKTTGIRSVFIDNIELIENNLSETLIYLKKLARELSLIIVTAVPLDNAGKSEQVKPSLNALKRKIPAIGRIADCILLIHRPIYYTLGPTEASLAHIILSKNKSDETGYFPVCLNKKTHIFEDFDLSKVTN